MASQLLLHDWALVSWVPNRASEYHGRRTTVEASVHGSTGHQRHLRIHHEPYEITPAAQKGLDRLFPNL
eukprot:12906616-Prorocentrum_lima.AAC.1